MVSNNTFDLILTDVIMPEMNGPTMVAEISEKLPDIKVLFMSGYPQEAMDHCNVDEGHLRLLKNPFEPDDLARAVRDVLDSSDLRAGAFERRRSLFIVDDEEPVLARADASSEG